MTGRYHRKQSPLWFLQRRGYVMFMLRELASFVIAGYLVLLVVFLFRLASGGGDFAAFLQTMASPLWRVLNALALIAAVWHAVTWFQATPKAVPVYLGEKKVGDAQVAIGMGYLPWVVVSGVVLWGILR